MNLSDFSISRFKLTLRACFATQLLANNIAPARVMKICGWKDLKTMERYIRLAGIDERGATDSLKLGTAADAVAEVIELFKFKADQELLWLLLDSDGNLLI